MHSATERECRSPRDLLPDLTNEIVTDPSTQSTYKFCHLVGQGSYGDIYKVIDTDTMQSFAIKVLRAPVSDTRDEFMMKREVEVHEKVSSHPNVATFHGWFKNKPSKLWFLKMDLIRGGTLLDIINEEEWFYEAYSRNENVRRALLQIIDAIMHCHGNGIAHRDIKPQNILCDEDAENMFLTDFGLCTSAPESFAVNCGSRSYLPPGKH